MATNLAPGVVPAIGALAQSTGVREALQWFTREKQWINEQHVELCRIPSPTFLEHQRAAWIATQFRGYGCDVQIDLVDRFAGAAGGVTAGGSPIMTLRLCPVGRRSARTEA